MICAAFCRFLVEAEGSDGVLFMLAPFSFFVQNLRLEPSLPFLVGLWCSRISYYTVLLYRVLKGENARREVYRGL